MTNETESILLQTARELDGQLAQALDNAHLMAAPLQVMDFILAGNAYFTIVSKVSGKRYTYRVSQPKGKDIHFVSYLTGPENTSDYTYLGIIRNFEFRTTAKSAGQLADGFPPAVAFAFLWKWVQPSQKKADMPSTMEFWHEGRCGRCGRKLTVPESIEAGIGPECASRRRE
jgi:hypothetical protein